MAQERTRELISDARTTVRRRSGESPVIVCIHGNSLSHRIFDPLFNVSALRNVSIVAYDLPGHGESDRPRDPRAAYSLRGYAAHLETLLETLGVTSYVLLGFSLGGHIAVEATADGLHPTPSGIVTIGSPPLTGPSDFARAFLPANGGASLFQETLTRADACAIGTTICRDEGVRADVIDSIMATDPAARANLFENIVGHAFPDECAFLTATGVPALLCFGGDEAIVNLEYLREKRVHERLGDRVRILPGESHLPDMSENGAFASALIAFLADCRPTRRKSIQLPSAVSDSNDRHATEKSRQYQKADME